MIGTLDPAQIEAVLSERPIGRLAVHADGRTYLVPVSYVYDGEAIYIHAREGLKLRMMRAAPEVCFQVDDVDVKDMANWRSVVAWGTFEELHGPAAAAAMDLLAAKLRPLTASETAGPSGRSRGRGGHGGIACRIVLKERTGRFESR